LLILEGKEAQSSPVVDEAELDEDLLVEFWAKALLLLFNDPIAINDIIDSDIIATRKIDAICFFDDVVTLVDFTISPNPELDLL
jgi:hypothetical protein